MTCSSGKRRAVGGSGPWGASGVGRAVGLSGGTRADAAIDRGGTEHRETGYTSRFRAILRAHPNDAASSWRWRRSPTPPYRVGKLGALTVLANHFFESRQVLNK